METVPHQFLQIIKLIQVIQMEAVRYTDHQMWPIKINRPLVLLVYLNNSLLSKLILHLKAEITDREYQIIHIPCTAIKSIGLLLRVLIMVVHILPNFKVMLVVMLTHLILQPLNKNEDIIIIILLLFSFLYRIKFNIITCS